MLIRKILFENFLVHLPSQNDLKKSLIKNNQIKYDKFKARMLHFTRKESLEFYNKVSQSQMYVSYIEKKYGCQVSFEK